MELKNISTGYGKKQVLFEISLKVGAGEIALLIGGNGAGKSTVLKCIYGLLKPWNDGKIVFDGGDITGLHSSGMLGRGLVYIPQKDNYFENLTVQENLETAGLNIRDKLLLKERIESVFSTFPVLAELRKKTPFRMSGGERQMLSLGMAMLHKPKMILLDEPTAGLTPKYAAAALDKISELKVSAGITFIIVEHRVREALKIAGRVIGLKYGKIYRSIDSYNYDNTNTANNGFELLNEVFV